MRFGGVSWNRSLNHKQGVRTRFKCKHCDRNYKMEWALRNHEKVCKKYWESREEDEKDSEN